MLPYNNGFIEISKNDIIIVFKKIPVGRNINGLIKIYSLYRQHIINAYSTQLKFEI